jgi:hypothetical protein
MVKASRGQSLQKEPPAAPNSPDIFVRISLLVLADVVNEIGIVACDASMLRNLARVERELCIQSQHPPRDHESNWLPVGDGPFNLMLRLYWPKEQILNGSWHPPAKKLS